MKKTIHFTGPHQESDPSQSFDASFTFIFSILLVNRELQIKFQSLNVNVVMSIYYHVIYSLISTPT